jgi:hypothetical protein
MFVKWLCQLIPFIAIIGDQSKKCRKVIKLNWKFNVLMLMPTRTYISKDSRWQRMEVMVMLGANANRDYKMKSVVICHAENPTALRGLLESSLHVYWHLQKRVGCQAQYSLHGSMINCTVN